MRSFVGAVVLAGFVITSGCAHGGARDRARGTAAFIAAAPTTIASDEPARLAKLAKGSGDDRAVRLDRLLDLLDASRFGGH
ncbi:MAG TPA: hypothetical protein VFG69_10405, partial [Nannocystaceae bacterium]|nr:hypothetical protein [Nannocystaceae bacterium]